MNAERSPNRRQLIAQIEELTEKLQEAEDALRVIHAGEVDAIVVSGSRGEQIFSLAGSDFAYRLIVQSMSEAALTTTLEGTILFCNTQFGRFLDAPLDELVGRPLAELASPADAPAVAALIRDAASGSVKRRIIFSGKTGQVPALVSANPLQQPDGPAICFVAADLRELESSTSVIQELNRKQRQLQESTERFGILSETANQLLRSKEPQAIVNSLCSRVMRLLHCHCFFNYLIEEDGKALHLNACAGISAATKKAIRRLEMGQAVCGLVAASGKPKVVESVQARSDPRTEIIRSLGIDAYACNPLVSMERVIGTLSFGCRDRSSFQAEDLALMKTVADQVAIAMERARAEENLKRLNEELETRVARRTEELSATNAELHREVEARAFAEKELRAESETRASVEERLLLVNAELEHRTVLLRNLARELAVTEQRERRRLADMLHDHLQQLLVGARYQIELLSRGGQKELKETVVLLDELLRKSIDISRTLTAELSPPVLHTSGLGPSLQWLAQRMRTNQNLEVNLELPPALPQISEEITIQLFQFVRELLFNAAKHARVKTARLQVTECEGLLRFEVSDTGVGFDPSRLDEKVGTETFGIFSIRERLDLIGGKLEIESLPGKGSRFTIAVPIARLGGQSAGGACTAGEGVRLGPALERASGSLPAKIRILLVDDHAVTRKGLAELMAKEPDLEIVGDAEDGKTALDLVSRLKPDIVVMDVNMPGMNGIEATRMIVNLDPQVKVVGLSMYEDENVGSTMLQAGAVKYVSKAGPPRLLIEAVRSCMHSAAM